MNNYQIFDLASVVHFFGWFVIGIFVKRKYILVFILGLLWELFEYYVTRENETTIKLLEKYWPVPKRLYEERNIMNKVMDMILNMSGYYLGNIMYNPIK
tara:strand:- start:1995 stop:2291 length:297 start_codon:yes stop_codon:yes gene_type:complete